MKRFDSLDKMCQDALADLVFAEQQLLQALPGIIEAASSTDLQQALLEQIKISESQLTRLKQAAVALDGTTQRNANDNSAKGYLHDDHGTNWEDTAGDGDSDASHTVGCHRVEHYEIAAYADLISCMKQLEKQSSLLIENLAVDADPSDRLGQLVMKVVSHRKREPLYSQRVSIQHC